MRDGAIYVCLPEGVELSHVEPEFQLTLDHLWEQGINLKRVYLESDGPDECFEMLMGDVRAGLYDVVAVCGQFALANDPVLSLMCLGDLANLHEKTDAYLVQPVLPTKASSQANRAVMYARAIDELSDGRKIPIVIEQQHRLSKNVSLAYLRMKYINMEQGETGEDLADYYQAQIRQEVGEESARTLAICTDELEDDPGRFSEIEATFNTIDDCPTIYHMCLACLNGVCQS